MIKKIIKAFPGILNNIDIKKKLLISYFVLIMLPLGLFTFVVYNKVSSNLKQQIIFSVSQSLNQAISFLEYKINNMIGITDSIFFNQDIQEILSKNKKSYYDDAFQQNADAIKLTNLCINFQHNENIYRTRLYVRSELIYSYENVNLFNIEEVKDTPWYKKLLNSKDAVLWCLPQDFSNSDRNRVIYLVREIRNSNFELIGVIRIDILESTIKDIISNANMSKKGLVYLQNEDGEIITSSNNEDAEKFRIDKNTLDALTKKDNKSVPLNINNEKFLINCTNIRKTGWRLVSIMPYREILSTGSQLRNYMLALMLIIIVAAYSFAYLISRSSIKRIGLLVKAMKKVENGDFNVTMPVHGMDEIGSLMEKFNYMIKRMAVMIEEQFKSGQKIKGAELKALQSQINPHFLYNTLDMINWSAAINQVPDIVLTVQNLAKFYKLSLSEGREVIPISDEIELIKVYLQIQNQRFEDSIKLELDIDEKIYEYGILKIILQPIVENSIIHGIREKANKSGTIQITGKLEDNIITLYVCDDGVGTSEQKLKNIFREANTNESHGYGIRNICERIKLYYGEQFGLTYISEPGKGTLVEIRIPAVKFV